MLNDRNKLSSIGYSNLENFDLPLTTSNDISGLFQCINITRCLPGKRISCIGNWNGQTIFAKFFFDVKRAKTHWLKEKSGYQLLAQKNITAPLLLSAGKHQQDDIYFIFFEFLKNTTSVKDSWLSTDETQRLQLLKLLTSTVSEHHHKGIIQQDLHLNNFLISNEKMYTLDGADITDFDSDDKKTAFNNLALLFAQFYPSNDPNIDLALKHYMSIRNWQLNPEVISQIKETTVLIREKRKKDRLDKTKRSCSLFYYHQDWNQLTICTRKFQSNQMQAFFKSPNSFINRGDLLKQGNTCTVASIVIDNKNMVVKRYNIKNWRHFLSRCLRESRAIKSWTNAHMLEFYGIPTAKPIAVIEKRWGPFRKTAYFLTELSEGEAGDDFFHSSPNPSVNHQALITSTVELIKSLHSLKISHGDLKISNFMVSGNKPSLLDLDSMKQHTCHYSFKKAQRKDISRFLKNWINSPALMALFKAQI